MQNQKTTIINQADSPYERGTNGGQVTFIEYFGGSHAEGFDNKEAILSAVSQGYPVRFGPWTYGVSGSVTISEDSIFLGVTGETTVQRLEDAGSSWLDFTGASVHLDGIIFDGNYAGGGNSNGVVIDSTVTSSVIKNCQFINNKFDGSSGENGLIYISSAGTDPVSHSLFNCIFTNNGFCGVLVEIVDNVLIDNCISNSNIMDGFRVYGDVNNKKPNQNTTITNCTSYGNNNNGITVCLAINGSLGYYSNSAPATIGGLISNNISYSNGAYGIYVGTLQSGIIANNIVYNNNYGNILAACSIYTKVINNQIYGTGTFGIDAAGGNMICVDDNFLIAGYGSQIGINIGGSNKTSCSRNKIIGYSTNSINVQNIEGDGSNNGFGNLDQYTIISDNLINYPDSPAYGINLSDNPTSVLIKNNKFFSNADFNGLRAVHDISLSTVYSGNSINNNTVINIPYSGYGDLVVPEWVQTLNIEPNGDGLSIWQISTNTQINIGSGVAYVIVNDGGSSYTSSSEISISGGTGTGASYLAFPWNGTVYGIRVESNGYGYGSVGSTFPLVISSPSGSGATATAYVGLPWKTNRVIKINNFSQYSIEIMGSALLPNSSVELVSNGTNWVLL